MKTIEKKLLERKKTQESQKIERAKFIGGNSSYYFAPLLRKAARQAQGLDYESRTLHMVR